MTRDKPDTPLTDQQRMFVSEYLLDLNASAAVVRAGYSARTARKIASHLMKKTHIAAAIRDEMERREKRTLITADRVLQEIADIAYANIADAYDAQGKLLPISKIPRTLQLAIETIQSDDRGVRIKLLDKLSALEKLARHLGLFNDKLSIKAESKDRLTLLLESCQGNTLPVVEDPPEFNDN